MNHNSPCRDGPIPHGTVFILFFIEKYLKKYFVLPKLALNEINYFVHHNSYNKCPNLMSYSFAESPSKLQFPTYYKISTNANHICFA
jgi:hypothetical protein